MLASRRLHGPQDGTNDGAADADKGDHDNEPPNWNGLRHGDTTTGFRIIFTQKVGPEKGRNESFSILITLMVFPSENIININFVRRSSLLKVNVQFQHQTQRSWG